MPPRDCLAAYCCACSAAATHSAAVAVLTRIRKKSEEFQSRLHACLQEGSFVALAEYESVLGRYACTCSTHRNPIAEPSVWGLGFRAWGLGFKVRAQKPARGIEVVGKHVGQNCCPGRDFAGGCCNWSNAAMNRCCRLAHADRARSFKSKKSTHHVGVRLLAPLPLRLSLSHTHSPCDAAPQRARSCGQPPSKLPEKTHKGQPARVGEDG